MKEIEVAVIGGGPAGMAAAVAAAEEGSKVLIIERNNLLGGILNQCIHNGFGLHYFKEELTGPEYAWRFVEKVEANPNIEVMKDAMVISVTADKVLTVISPEYGCVTIKAEAIVLTMGCRERSGGAIQLCGSRPAGIYTAGAAQRIVNIEGYRIGKKAVILGSGDIGLIMARRMTFEGAKVVCACEIMPYSSGLKRNIVQCLNDFNIPLYFSTTVTRVVGKTRLEGVYICPVDERLRPIPGQERFVECDTLLLSVGLIPENDLVSRLPIKMDSITSGAVVNDKRETTVEGIFAAGNVLHVHDLVDNACVEAEIAGKYASMHAQGTIERKPTLDVKGINGVRYALPQKVSKEEEKVKIFFRVDNVYRNARLNVKCGEKLIHAKKFLILSPGEMESVSISTIGLNAPITLELEAPHD